MIIVAVILLLIAGFIWWNGRIETQPTGQEMAQPIDTTDAIESELAGIDVGELDAEFKDVDEALKGL